MRGFTSTGFLPALALFLAPALLAAPSEAHAQDAPPNASRLAELTATPEATAELFLRSLRTIRWSAAAQFMEQETLERFQALVTMVSDADPTGSARQYFAQSDSLAYQQLTAAQVFDRSVGIVIDSMPGLMHSIFDRDDEVIGQVPDGSAVAHVVYRTTARISGAEPEIKVMQMAETPAGWRVRWSDELGVLEEAVRGVARSRRGPPGSP